MVIVKDITTVKVGTSSDTMEGVPFFIGSGATGIYAKELSLTSNPFLGKFTSVTGDEIDVILSWLERGMKRDLLIFCVEPMSWSYGASFERKEKCFFVSDGARGLLAMRSVAAFIMKITIGRRHDLNQTSLRGNSLFDWTDKFRARFGTRNLRELLKRGLIDNHTNIDWGIVGELLFSSNNCSLEVVELVTR